MSLVARSMGRSGEEEKHYPPPLASHEDLVRDPNVFWDTLRRFHFVMGTKFTCFCFVKNSLRLLAEISVGMYLIFIRDQNGIPVIGGKELGLHVLYVEVTRRSGYEKVVAVKKWREVGSVFNFSATATSASFVLRKHYLALLYHYEQVHFFKVQGPLFTPSAPASVSNHSWRPDLAIVQYSPKLNNDHPDSHAEGASFLLGKGTIEGKFDCGYLVSVKLGSEVLRGVLYHSDSSVPPPRVQQYENAIVPFNNNNKPSSSGRRRKNKRRWDPNYPKPNRSGYNFFFAEKHYKLKELCPNREREFTKMIGQSWNSLCSEERMVYQNIGLMDKERYKRELKEYKEKMILGQTVAGGP